MQIDLTFENSGIGRGEQGRTGADLVNGIEVNGYRLGGHLATAFNLLYHSMAEVTNA
jgi:hypothetical protein